MLESGTSTVTPLRAALLKTTARQARRECSERLLVLYRRSSSSFSIGDKQSSPFFTITWQVMQAQMPPQECLRSIP